MASAPQKILRLSSLAVLPLACVALSHALAGRVHAQTEPPQQAPAPIVRPRPRPSTQTSPSGAAVQSAPPDAAPLVARPPRPRPVNPQTLSGATAATGQSATPKATHAAATTPASAARPASSPSATAPARTASATPPRSTPSTLNRTTVVIDPGHGGQDSGSRIGDNIAEKDVTLALAFRLRSLLTARGFSVVLTRDSDAASAANAPGSPLTLDDRAGIANHARAAACLLLHATGRGNGVHLYGSDLDPARGEASVQPWLTAQAAWVPASQALQHGIAAALGRSHIALISSTASVRPVDSLTCPALVLELAPEGDDPQSINDAGYQERVAAAIAGALVFWQNQVQPPQKLAAALPAVHTPPRHKPVAPPTPPESQP